jgi:hypothetical protein
MLSDLAALTPPLLVCAAFLFAVGAFLRKEMRGDDSPAEDAPADVSGAGQNLDSRRRTPRAATARTDRDDGPSAASED